ncbi:apoptosis facilitator Bcl-2-like protein 14 isoform X3 [Hypomesus transpacificus]|uniref:apoptosis facilitator Bcl-2-like protein 14 isoform X3 n=1 Tax=Hypomesus transpacificus TaxID=137520 RepID=UPI001F076CA3|nr:apoptosis facilitator Bcl-2-like protein 14 isoform X3 [Hypomesus transpacificus]
MEFRAEEDYGVDTNSDEYVLLQAYCTRRSRHKPKSFMRAEGSLPPLAPGPSLLGERGKGIRFEGLMRPPSGPYKVTQRAYAESGARETIFKKKPVAIFECASGADIQPGSSGSGAADEGRGLTAVADRLTEIADDVNVQIREPSSLEPDSPENPEDVIQKLVELLKNSGDQLNEEIQRNQAMQTYLQSTFTYALFEQVTSRVQEVVSGGSGGRTAQARDRLERQQIAVAFEVTSRLSAVDLLPMSRAMGYGTHYVQIHHSSWVKQRGGWKKVFESEDID